MKRPFKKANRQAKPKMPKWERKARVAENFHTGRFLAWALPSVLTLEIAILSIFRGTPGFRDNPVAMIFIAEVLPIMVGFLLGAFMETRHSSRRPAPVEKLLPHLEEHLRSHPPRALVELENSCKAAEASMQQVVERLANRRRMVASLNVLGQSVEAAALGEEIAKWEGLEQRAVRLYELAKAPYLAAKQEHDAHVALTMALEEERLRNETGESPVTRVRIAEATNELNAELSDLGIRAAASAEDLDEFYRLASVAAVVSTK